MEPVSLGVEKGQQDAVDRRAIAFFEEMIGELARIGEAGLPVGVAEQVRGEDAEFGADPAQFGFPGSVQVRAASRSR